MFQQEFDLTGRIALVTGASRGIGRQLCIELAKRGAHIIAIARTVGGLEELDDEINTLGGSATLVPLDLHDMEAIDQLGVSIHERWGKLDILFANAAILGNLTPVPHMDVKTFEDILTVNYTSHWRLIRAVDTLLHKSDAGRAIIISSILPHSSRAFWGPYAASKAALEVLARCWADENEETNLRINCADPGVTSTTMRAQAMPGEDPTILPTPEEIAERIVYLASPKLQNHGSLFNANENRFMTYHLPD